jgi:hypothetical protein
LAIFPPPDTRKIDNFPWQSGGEVLDMRLRACRPILSARLCALLENMVIGTVFLFGILRDL